MESPKSFAEFWPHYLNAHQNATARLLHYIGTFAGTCCLMLLILTGNLWFFPLGFVIGYGCAWFGHFFVENNVPLAFSKPLYSFMADYKMLWNALLGRLAPQLEAARKSA